MSYTSTKISALPSGGAVQAGDIIPVVRLGATYGATATFGNVSYSGSATISGQVPVFNNTSGTVITGSALVVTGNTATISASEGGISMIMGVANTALLTGSSALLTATVNFSSAATAALQVSNGTNYYTVGLDNSDAAKFKMSASAVIGTNPFLIYNTAAKSIIIASNSTTNSQFTVTGSYGLLQATDSGASVQLIVENSSNTSGSTAQLIAQSTSNSGGTIGGSPSTIYTQFNYSPFWQTGIWAAGDGGDNFYHIAPGNFSSSDPLYISTAGIINMPSGTLTIKSVPYTFPSGQGAANTFLMNNGSGVLSWVSGGGSGGGNVVGPSSSAIGQVATFNNTSGTSIVNVPVSIDGSGNISRVNTLTWQDGGGSVIGKLDSNSTSVIITSTSANSNIELLPTGSGSALVAGNLQVTGNTLLQGTGLQLGTLNYVVPTSQAAGVLINNGSGLLSWGSPSGAGKYSTSFTTTGGVFTLSASTHGLGALQNLSVETQDASGNTTLWDTHIDSSGNITITDPAFMSGDSEISGVITVRT